MFSVKVLLIFVSLQAGLVYALQDPTRPLGDAAKTLETSYRLQSILISNERKLAVINGRQLQENQLVYNSDGVRVIKIEPYRVLLQQGDKRWALTLRERSLVKSTATNK